MDFLETQSFHNSEYHMKIEKTQVKINTLPYFTMQRLFRHNESSEGEMESG